MGAAYQKLITLALPTADADGISTAQTPGAAGNLTITGALASGGVANLVVARRVLVTTVSDESGKTLTIYGTDRYGRTQSEAMTGPNATTGYTTRDFLTVTRVAVSAAFTGNVTVGTNGVGSSAPIVMDAFANPAVYGCAVDVTTGSANYTVQAAMNDFSPDWDLINNLPDWYGASGFSAQAGHQDGNIPGPVNLIRLTINSGTGTVAMKLIQPLSAGAF